MHAVLISVLFATIFAVPAHPWGDCPEGSERIATSWPDRPWVCALTDGPREGDGCPKGSRELTVPSGPRPFRCALDGADPEPPAGGCPRGQRRETDAEGRARCVTPEAPAVAPPRRPKPRCRKGYEPAFTPSAKLGYRCVRSAAPPEEAAAAPEPLAACPPGTRRVKTENPFAPFGCETPGRQAAPPLKGPYARYEVPRELAFEYPEAWQVRDDWKDEVPSIYIQPELARDGKPVVLTLSRYRADHSPYPDMDSAIRQEIEWHDAKEGGRGSVAGLPARFLEVPNQTKLAYVRTATGYFVLGYSAPEDLFRTYAPAYSRLLKSLRVVHDEKDPMPEEE